VIYYIPLTLPPMLIAQARRQWIDESIHLAQAQMELGDCIVINDHDPRSVLVYYIAENQPAMRVVDRADLTWHLQLDPDEFLRDGLAKAVRAARDRAEAEANPTPATTIDGMLKALIAEEVSRQLAPLQARLATLENRS